MAVAKIFNIQSFSTTDGPGIRTVVFFQGCNLSCAWCHNPESRLPDAPEAFIQEKCIGCGACGAGGECYAQARIKTCREFTPDGLFRLLEIDLPYLKNSGGGVTFSGGECMLQADFLEEMVKICSEKGIHTAVDTAGHVPYEWLTRVNPNMFLYDIKALSPEVHKKLVGVDGVLIWENLEKLLRDGFRVQVRIPCVPGANWDELPLIFEKLRDIGAADVELLAYHRLGEGKNELYNLSGKEVPAFKPPTKKEMEELWNLLSFPRK
ncbi:MAG: radical SAM protein [Defluviitaleaceae bacterium]|nr:radical SAM protein [Defluviitaleaceae bacterium]